MSSGYFIGLWWTRGQYHPRKLQSVQLNRNASPVIWSFGQRTVDLICVRWGVVLNFGIDYKQLTCGGRDFCMSFDSASAVFRVNACVCACICMIGRSD